MSSKFIAWFKNLGKVDALDPRKAYWDQEVRMPYLPEPSSNEEKLETKIELLERKNTQLERRASHFKSELIKISRERKSITPDDFGSQLDSLLRAQEAMTFHDAVSHQNPLTTVLLQSNLYEEKSKMWFLAFESPSLTDEEAEARYQKYLAETTAPENE